MNTKAAKRARANVTLRTLTRKQGMKVLERQAQRYLGVSAATFIRAYSRGEYKNGKRELAERVAVYLPFAV